MITVKYSVFLVNHLNADKAML